jgi:hypothetical protein
MLILQSQDKFDEFLEFEPYTGKIKRLSNYKDKKISINGHFTKTEDHFLCFYRLNNILHFRFDSQDISINDNMRFEFLRNTENSLHIIENNKIIFSLTYRHNLPENLYQKDLTPFVEEEDFDFCLFFFNVITNKVRRDIIYR